MKAKHEPSFYIFWATGIVMLIAMGLFGWSILESSREGARVTASESPRTGGGQAADAYQTLSRVYPPSYRDLDTNAHRPPELRAAIERYSQRDYAAAIPAFSTVIEKQPDCVEARLYLGICYLFGNNRKAGIDELRSAVAAGPTPYQEQARFYLAKGLLGMNDIAGARQQLNDTIAMHGYMEQQAETLLARIR